MGDLVDMAIPLIGGILLVACPQIFIRKTASDLELAVGQARLRKIGVLLLVAAAGIGAIVVLTRARLH